MTLADNWANCFANYAKDRGSIYGWQSSAGNLIHAYEALESYGFLINSTNEQIKSLQEEIADLKTKLDAQTKRADRFEKRFGGTWNALIDIHNKLEEREKELSDIRGQDIRSSFDSHAGVLQGKFGGDDDE